MGRRTPLRLAFGALVAFAAFLGSAHTADAAPKKKPRRPTHKPAPPAPAPKEDAASFDREAASSALTSVDLQKCRATNAARGEGHVVVTFMPTGSAKTATVDRGPWLGTPVAKCIAGEFKKAKVPAFSGEPVIVGKTFRVD